jgi:hypothetical protein
MKEMIERLKNTWTAFGGLTKEEQDFLREHMKDAGLVCSSGEIIDHLADFYETILYRLRPDFELPEPVKEPRFVEYYIIQDGLFYVCSVSHLRKTDESVLFNLSDLPSIVGFAGVQFKESCGWITPWMTSLSYVGADHKPAKPIKARFCITKGEK